MSENTTTHEEVNKNLVNGGQPAEQRQPAATAAEPKNEQPTAEQAAPAAPTKVEEPAAPSSPHVGLIARVRENWDVLACGAAIGVGIGLATGAICFGGKKEAAVVV